MQVGSSFASLPGSGAACSVITNPCNGLATRFGSAEPDPAGRRRAHAVAGARCRCFWRWVLKDHANIFEMAPDLWFIECRSVKRHGAHYVNGQALYKGDEQSGAVAAVRRCMR